MFLELVVWSIIVSLFAYALLTSLDFFLWKKEKKSELESLNKTINRQAADKRITRESVRWTQETYAVKDKETYRPRQWFLYVSAGSGAIFYFGIALILAFGH